MALSIPRAVAKQVSPELAALVDRLTVLCAFDDHRFLTEELIALLDDRIREMQHRADDADHATGHDRRSG